MLLKHRLHFFCQQIGGQFCHGIGCNISPKHPSNINQLAWKVNSGFLPFSLLGMLNKLKEQQQLIIVKLTMIASQKIGKSFMGALNYNLKKLDHADPNRRAELLDSNFTTLEKIQIKKEVELLRQLRPNLNRYVYHTSLNFSKDEEKSLDNLTMLAIAHEYLRDNGFTQHQYLIFRHYDADHPHLHLLVNRIGFDGSVVSDSNNYKKSEGILRKLEKKYKLMPVPSSKQTKERAAKKDELEMVIRKGKPSDKMLLQQIIKQLINTRDITLQQFINEAEAKGVHLIFNQATTGRVSGITYFHDGFKIKGQALGKYVQMGRDH